MGVRGEWQGRDEGKHFKNLSKENVSFFKNIVCFNLVTSKISTDIHPGALKKPQDVDLLILLHALGHTLLNVLA